MNFIRNLETGELYKILTENSHSYKTLNLEGTFHYVFKSEIPQRYDLVEVERKQEPVHTNEEGGKQSDVDYAFSAIPPNAILAVASVFKQGLLRYGRDNWKKIPTEDHINHAVGHSFKHLSGDRTEAHLANAACRALMALEMFLEQKNDC
jgi:hypothetical protein